MGWTEINGGRPIAPAEWATAATAARCRVEFPPSFEAVTEGQVWVRFGHPAIAGDRDVLVRLAMQVGEDRVMLRTQGWTIASFVAEPVLALAYAAASGGESGGADKNARLDDETVARALSGVAAWGESLFPHGVPREILFEGWDALPADPD